MRRPLSNQLKSVRVRWTETLQVYNPKTEGSVDILEDLWAIASATDPTGSPRINAQGISARSAVMEI